MYNTRTNISIHTTDQTKHIVHLENYDEPRSFHVFKIATDGSEVNYFFSSETQLSKFIQQLKNLTDQFDRISPNQYLDAEDDDE